MTDYNGGGEIRTVNTGTRDNSIMLVLALGLLSLLAGIVGGMTGWGIAFLFKSPHPLEWFVGGAVFFLAGAFVFAFFQLFYLIERWLGIDINHDGTVGEPEDQPQFPPRMETKYLTPVDVHDDPDNKLNSRRVNVETERDDTLVRMAVILSVRGWNYFTADNFTSAKSETQLMSYDHWKDVFLPQMLAARLVKTSSDSRGRNRVELTDMGKEMMTKLAGAADRGAQPTAIVPQAQPVYNLTIPLPQYYRLSRGRKNRNG